MSSPAGGKLFLLAGVVRAPFVHSLATAYDERVERKHTPARQARSVARLAAVQALYQMEVGGAGAKAVAREFVQHRFDADLEGELLAAADQHFFAELIEGVVASQAAVDRAIVGRLASGWKLKRLDATARAILRAGAYELIATPKTPREIVIDEYVEIAKSFFAGVEVGFINATLDAIARDARGE